MRFNKLVKEAMESEKLKSVEAPDAKISEMVTELGTEEIERLQKQLSDYDKWLNDLLLKYDIKHKDTNSMNMRQALTEWMDDHTHPYK